MSISSIHGNLQCCGSVEMPFRPRSRERSLGILNLSASCVMLLCVRSSRVRLRNLSRYLGNTFNLCEVVKMRIKEIGHCLSVGRFHTDELTCSVPVTALQWLASV